jgi:hypothetical protein
MSMHTSLTRHANGLGASLCGDLTPTSAVHVMDPAVPVLATPAAVAAGAALTAVAFAVGFAAEEAADD